MRAPVSRNLVIDTDVTVQAAGELQEPPGPLRAFLETVFTCCHKAVLSPEIRREWEAHSSRFLRRWRTRMAKNGKTVEIPSTEDRYFRDLLARSPLGGKQREAVAKDAHLLEAALATGRIVVSNEQEAERLFSTLARDHQHFAHLRDVVWANPGKPRGHDLLAWLEAGAEALPDLTLGSDS